MKPILCATVALLLAMRMAADEPFVAHAVVVPESQHAFSASWPVTDEELEKAQAIYVWTDDLPIRRFTRDEFLRVRARLREELAKAVVGTQRIRVTTQSRRKNLRDVVVRYAPAELWTQIPEALLPVAQVSEGGLASLPYRDLALRLRAVRAHEGTGWRDLRPAKTIVEVNLMPAEDATLSLVGDARIENATATLLVHERGAARPVLRAQYAADPKNEIRIPSLPEFDVVTLLLFAPGFAPASISGNAEDISRTVELARAGALRGRFIDERRKPVAGARVSVESWLADDLPALSRSETVSDAKGQWVLRDLPLRETTLVAQANGFAAHHDSVVPSEAEEDLGDITLEPAARLVLEIVDDAEMPVKDASVRCGGIRAGKTNEKGVLAIAEASSREPAALTIESPGFETVRVSIDPPFANVERVTLHRRFVLRGELVDEQMKPVTDGRVLVEIGNTYRTESIRDDGTFEIAAGRGREVRLTFESPSTASHTITEPPGDAGEVRQLGAIRLERGNVVRGRVVTRGGEPVRDARVWVLRPTASGTVGSWLAERALETRSRHDGMFELRGLVTGAALMRIDARGFARAQRSLTIDGPAAEAGDIVLTRGSEVVVTLQSKVSGAVARLDLTGSWLEVDMLTASIQDGRATLRSVPPGEYTATVAQGLAVICERRVEVPDDGSRVEVECAAPARVTGIVLIGNSTANGGSLSWSRAGRAVTESVISNDVTNLGTRRQQVHGAGAGMTVARVESDGRFSIDALLPGAWDVTWWSNEGASMKPRRVDVPDAPFAEITLRYDGTVLSGVVIDEEGAPVAMARVQSDLNHVTLSREDGAFALAGLLPGRYALQARKGAVASRPREVLVEGNDPISGVRLALDPDISDAVRVRVIASTGEPAANAFVFVDSDLGARIVTADATGQAEAVFAAGRPSNVRLAAFHRGTWAFGAADSREDVQVLTHGAVGSIRVTSDKASDGLRLLAPQGMDVLWMLSRLGIPASLAPHVPLLISGLPPGRYTLVSGNGRVVDVREGDTVDVRLP